MCKYVAGGTSRNTMPKRATPFRDRLLHSLDDLASNNLESKKITRASGIACTVHSDRLLIEKAPTYRERENLISQ